MIKKTCSTLIIEEGYIDQSIIPPIIDQQRGHTKIFQVYFRSRGALIDTIISKNFYDDQISILLPSPLATTCLDPMMSDLKQLTAR